MNYARGIMFRLTGLRRYNPEFRGSHVHVHGSTRHTSAALLLHNPSSSSMKPDDDTILEIQKREDMRTFKKHYFHVDGSSISSGLEYGSAPGLLYDTHQEKRVQPRRRLPTKTSPTLACVPKIVAPPPSHTGAPAGEHLPTHASRNAWRKNKRKLGFEAWKNRARTRKVTEFHKHATSHSPWEKRPLLACI